jgi:hypothetical protein
VVIEAPGHELENGDGNLSAQKDAQARKARATKE